MDVCTIESWCKTVTAGDCSCLLTFLDRFSNPQAAETKLAVFPLQGANIFALRFLKSARRTVKSALDWLGLRFHLVREEDFTIVCHKQEEKKKLQNNVEQLETADFVVVLCEATSARVLSLDEIKSLILPLENFFSQKLCFNYNTMVNEVLESVRECFIKEQPQYAQQYNKVTWDPNVISGEDLLIHLETGFGSGGLQINYPDANTFTEKHWDDCGNAQIPHRDYRDWAFHIIHWIPHEFLHCVDNINRKLSPKFWQNEHIPSFMQLNLLCHISREKPKLLSEFHHEGWFEDVLLWFVEYLVFQDSTATDDLREKYLIWRDNSLAAPSKLEPVVFEEENKGLYDYLLGRIALESFDYDNPAEKLQATVEELETAAKSEGTLEWPPKSLYFPSNLTLANLIKPKSEKLPIELASFVEDISKLKVA